SKIEADQTKAESNVAAFQDKLERAAISRLSYAIEYAQKYGVELEVLMGDKTLTTPEQMEFKAEKLKFDQDKADATGTDKFDSGQRGAASLDRDKMSASEKIRAGV
ncbi:hypothetical protein LCGC14_2634240, partial [marine sediment metagenome]